MYQSLQEKTRDHEAKMEAERTKTAQVHIVPHSISVYSML